MRILDIWDWKYKLLLSESTFEKVSTFIKDLKSDEKNIYKSIIEFYSSFYSFDVLLNLLSEQGADRKKIMSLATKNREKAIKVPTLLKNYYIEKIKTINVKDIYIEEELKYLLSSIIDDNTSCIKTDKIQNVIFGKYYPEIKKSILINNPISEKNKDLINVKDIKAYTEQLLSSIKKDKEVVSNFGKCLIGEYDINVIKAIGFAEWWDKDLTNENKDLLVLYDNKDALNRDDFEYTIYHEIYPGHGQFYNYARMNSTTIPKFDHGAMSLIEGWATYCEWNVKDTSYSRSLKERGKEFLDISILKSIGCKDKIELIYNRNIKRGYTKEQAINSVLYFSQYPGFLESYYLGALCIEEIVNSKAFGKPLKFLEYLNDKTWGGVVCIMGVVAYLVNGFDVGEEICKINNSSVIRNEITSPPDIIEFTTDELKNIKVYRNSINSCVSIQEYHEFNTYEEAYKSFYNDHNELYDNLYKECINNVNKRYKTNLKNTDWNTLICVDNQQQESLKIEKQNVIVVNNLDINKNIGFRAIIDSSLVYQSVSRILTFLKKLIFTKSLTKFQQLQIAYYSQELSKIKNPDMFLTNRKEIEIYKKIYSEWELGSQIENATDMINQCISNYSFLWEYNNSNSQKFSNLMITLFTIVVGYPSLKKVINDFLPNGMQEVNGLFYIFVIILIINIIWIQIKNIKEAIELKKRWH